MDVALAREYHKQLSIMLAELQRATTVDERLVIATRMNNLLHPMYVVHSSAAHHITESLRKLKYPDLPIVNAALHTIKESLQTLYEVIENHTEPHFVVYGTERVFAKPVAEEELRAFVEKGKLLGNRYEEHIHALDAPEDVEKVLLKVDPDVLKPVLARLGFPHATALVLFTTKAQPSLGVPIENIPSLRMVQFRSGVPLQVIKHRIL